MKAFYIFVVVAIFAIGIGTPLYAPEAWGLGVATILLGFVVWYLATKDLQDERRWRRRKSLD